MNRVAEILEVAPIRVYEVGSMPKHLSKDPKNVSIVAPRTPKLVL